MRRVQLVFFLIFVLATGLMANAQSELLVNPGLEEGSSGPYTTRRGGEFPIYLPNSWNVWLASPTGEYLNRSERVSINPHPGPGPSPKEGSRALNVDCGFVTCTAAIYQQVAVQENSNVQASAWSQVKVCNLPSNGTTCGSAVESGAQTRIGIDPNGGTDPNDGDVVWSNWSQPHDQWLQISVSATTTGTTATLFLYSTQTSPGDLNRSYWDQATLTGGGSGGAVAGASTPVPTVPPEVAFVVPQNEREDGSIVHTVSSGDTLDSIAVAYGLTRADLLTLNNISDPRIISIGQEIIIREPLPTEGEAFSEEVEESATADGESTAEPEATDEAGNPIPAEEQPEDNRPNPRDTAPPAPVLSIADGRVLPSSDPSVLAGSVCVMLFNDVNQNRIQEPDETLLEGGSVNLSSGAEVVQSFETTVLPETQCFTDISAGTYVLAAAAPTGYGMTSPDQLSLRIAPGSKIDVAFGAAEGVQAVAPPPADEGGSLSEVVSNETVETRSTFDQIFNISGLVIFGLAGVILVAGMSLALFMRRR